jgi:hypothetical protein
MCADFVPVPFGHFRPLGAAATKGGRPPIHRLENRMRQLRLLLAPLVLALACAAPGAHATSPNGLVVNQVYAGGGNSGATYQNDFVELFNAGPSTVDLAGWTLQYASSGSTSWQATPLSGTVAAGHSYLVQLASTASVGATLPTPDATGTSNLAASGGKVAVVHDTAPLSCGGSAGSCSASSIVADLVGYGSAVDYEGSGPAPALSATTADMRAAGGCTDTDSNAADFTTATPTPRNSASTASSCAPAATGPSASTNASVDVDLQPMIAVAVDHTALGFGTVAVGATPTPLPETITVTSTGPAGYSLTVHRSAFSPGDLPLGLGAGAPAGAQLGAGLGGGALASIPVAPAADLLVGSRSSAAQASGDVWPAEIGFTSPLPALAAGHYTATVTFTVIGH